ncbi:MAG: 2-dehydropantoate 2-reductase [Pseudomonadota bacterium]
MRIAIMGTGALGGTFGARLAAAGHDVHFIARGANLEAMRARGLRLISPHGDVHLDPVQVAEDPSEIGPVDVVFFMVKNTDVESAGQAILPLMQADTSVLTTQNGVTAWDRLGEIIGHARVIPGVVRFPSRLVEPGVIEHYSDMDAVHFNEIAGGTSPRTEALADMLRVAGIRPVLPDNIHHDLWEKFCSQCMMTSLTALTRLPLGPLRDTPETAAMIRDGIEEVCSVGRAIVPDLPQDMAEKGWHFVQQVPATLRTSMQEDLLREKPLEHEFLAGDVVRLGARYGVPTPIHTVLYNALKPVSDLLKK